jgi:hypothetical protein
MKCIPIILFVLITIALFSNSAYAGGKNFAVFSYYPNQLKTTYSGTNLFKGSASAQWSYTPLKGTFSGGNNFPSGTFNFNLNRIQPTNIFGSAYAVGKFSYNMKTQMPTWQLGGFNVNANINRQLITGGAKFTATMPKVTYTGGAGFNAVKTGESYLRIRVTPARFVYSPNAYADP